MKQDKQTSTTFRWAFWVILAVIVVIAVVAFVAANRTFTLVCCVGIPLVAVLILMTESKRRS